MSWVSKTGVRTSHVDPVAKARRARYCRDQIATLLLEATAVTAMVPSNPESPLHRSIDVYGLVADPARPFSSTLFYYESCVCYFSCSTYYSHAAEDLR